MNIRKIQMYPFIEDLHTIHNSIVSQPPEGYVFIGAKTSNLYDFRKKISHSRTIRAIIRPLYHAFLKIFRTTKIIEATQKGDVMSEADLVFSGTLIYNSPKPWVLYMFDHPACLAGNNYELFIKNKPRIEKALADDSCKKIICTNEAPISFMKEHFPESITDKVIVIRSGIEDIGKNRWKKGNKNGKNNKKLKLLFMGSINNPLDFYVKGGLYVLETFERLSRKRKDIELIMRCQVSPELKKRYGGIKGLQIIEEKVAFDKILSIYQGADLLFAPGHNYSVTSFLEGMSFGLPIIALNTYAVEDFVKTGFNGIIVKRSELIEGYKNKGYPTFIRTDEFTQEIKTKKDSELIERLVSAINSLADNKKLRDNMSKNARKEFEDKYTIPVRNQEFRKVFDEISSEKV